MEIIRDINLNSLTTIRLGGKAKYFASVNSVDEVRRAIRFARESELRIFILGGGSNVVFSDEGFDGMVIKIDIKGVQINENVDTVEVQVSAGESWDDLVKLSTNKGFQGIECLSGIPGLVGATPMQNVGAYGQEVSDTIVKVIAINLEDLTETQFSNEDCRFAYRSSRFKVEDKGKFVITSVTFRLNKNSEPVIKYPDLETEISFDKSYGSLAYPADKLKFVREKVLGIRKRKSMVINPADPNSVSCGSFFMNPILIGDEFKAFSNICEQKKMQPKFFKSGELYKIPAAWLIEQAGFRKGYRLNGVGISENHSLALININGSTNELLNLSEHIRQKVLTEFRIELKNEPEFVE